MKFGASSSSWKLRKQLCGPLALFALLFSWEHLVRPYFAFLDLLAAEMVTPLTHPLMEWPPTELCHNGRCIISVTNADFIDFADNFASHLSVLNVTNFALVPLDLPSHNALHAAFPEHTLPILTQVESQGRGERTVLLLPEIVQPFLRKGYAVFYNDVDTVWQKNAWDYIDAELRTHDSNHHSLEKLLWQDTEYQLCSCMFYLLPTQDSIDFMEEWKDAILRKAPPDQPNNVNPMDQDAFNIVIENRNYSKLGGFFHNTKVIVNDAQFPAGKHYSWRKGSPENDKAVIVHNNWIVGKFAAKRRFERAGLWHPSGRLSRSDEDDWPPSKMIHELLVNAAVPSSTHTKEGTPRVVVAATNFEFVDFADNLANSLLALNISNFVFVPLDRKAYELLHAAYPEHTLPMMPALDILPDGKAEYDSQEFKAITGSRPLFLQAFLRKGFAVLYVDTDMVWRQNAWEVIDKRDTHNDSDTTPVDVMLWKDADIQICTCLMYLKPKDNVLSLLQRWDDEMSLDVHSHDQHAFCQVAEVLGLPFSGGEKDHIRVYPNDLQFLSGRDYSFYENIPENSESVIVHNNFVIGKRTKLTRFEKAGLWKPSGRLAPDMFGP